MASLSELDRRGLRAIALVAVWGLLAACGQAGAGGNARSDPSPMPADPAAPAGDVAGIDRSLADHPPEEVADVAAGFNRFGFGLLDELRAATDAPNVVLSPLSAGAALSLVTAGAAGDTADELAGALGVDAQAPGDGRVGALLVALAEAEGADLTLANAVWTQPDFPLTESFRTAAGDALGATVDELELGDAEQVAAIDRWASQHTDGLVDTITDVLQLPDPKAVAVLANATHFAGTWTTEFDPADTRQAAFTRDDGSTVTAPLMTAEHMNLAMAVDRDADVKLARLPYGESKRFAFEVVVPTDDTPIAEVLADVDASRWRELSQQATPRDDLRVVLPRFAVESTHKLVEPLQALGVRRAFTSDSDFTPMSPANPRLDTVAQKAVVEVDESGTKAAAVTGAVMAVSEGPEIVIDRSFAFAIRDTTTGANLFVGMVGDPTA